MKVKTSELEGAALDWAVAVALNGKSCFFDAFGSRMLGRSLLKEVVAGDISPSTDWSQGGPLIEDFRACIECTDESQPKDRRWWQASILEESYALGPTPLVAACRAIVAAKLGDEVEVPDELI